MPILGYTKQVAIKKKAMFTGPGMTIRPSGRRKFKRGDVLYHYTGPYLLGQRVKLGETICVEVVRLIFTMEQSAVGIWGLYLYGLGDYWKTGLPQPGPGLKYGLLCQELALNDGFESIYQFDQFFINQYKLKLGDSKEMIIIRW